MAEKRNLKIISLEEARKICSLNDCRGCPLSDEEGYCRFVGIAPDNWRLD